MKRPLFFNYISTGCTCCSNANFCEGPFETLEDAMSQAEMHNRRATLSSQYAKNGNQDTYTAECLVIDNPDGDGPIVLIPGGVWTAGFGGNRLPADTRFDDSFEYVGSLHARKALKVTTLYE